MGKVLRGYAKGKDGKLILRGTMPILHCKDKPIQVNAGTKDTWSGRVQRSLRKKQWIDVFRTLDARAQENRKSTKTAARPP